MSRQPLDIARSLHAALEAGIHGEGLRHLFAPSATTVEHPNAREPKGARMTLDEMLAASAAGAGMLSSQRFAVRSSAVAGSTAIFTLTWTGVVAREIGPFRAGQELVAHIAQFIETDGERITAIETYDCYEPFASA